VPIAQIHIVELCMWISHGVFHAVMARVTSSHYLAPALKVCMFM